MVVLFGVCVIASRFVTVVVVVVVVVVILLFVGL